MIDPELIATGRAKLAAATPGPWEQDDTEIYQADSWNEDGFRRWVAESCDADLDDYGAANADLIVWSRNNLAAVLDELEFREVALERLKQAVERDFAAIAAKHERDKARHTKAVAIVKQHANHQLAALVEAALDGNDE
ncbi:hypothetical protein [Nocardia africana]